ncbi:MAG TPA: heme-binding domain-containing protein [Chitinophagaceae bacterium]|nr:heme-binding domain-containing protein [Chitinophagaceae bacterium]
MIRKIMIVLLIALVIIQFFHPKRNKAEGEQANYIGKVFTVPDDVKSILAKGCNDCHSNNTRYPWYCNFQPIDWWTNNHVKDGMRHLNFDEFSNKSLRYQYNKIGEVSEQIKKGEMPINSYTWIHKDAILTDAEKSKIYAWTDAIRDSMKAKYPIDSLIRKRPQ